MNFPLAAGGPDLSVEGGIIFDGASLKIAPIDTGITALQGTIGFTDSGVNADNLHAVFLDTPVLIDARPHTAADGRQSTRISVRGDLQVRRLLETLAIPLDDRFVGSSDWLAEIDVAEL